MYLLDDPLSAVDAHVGEHLVTHCLQTLLHARGATVVLASEKSVAIVSRSSVKASGVGSSMRRFSSPRMILKCMVVVVSFIVS